MNYQYYSLRSNLLKNITLTLLLLVIISCKPENGLYVDEYGNKSWYKNGKMHREDGPAVIETDGSKEWFINGVEYSEEGWKEKVKSLK